MVSYALSSIDLFGVPVLINFGGKPKFKSNIGGICTLIFLGFIIWALYNQSHDFFQKKNPKFIQTETYTEDPRSIILSRETFPIAFAVRTPESMKYTAYINDSIYTQKIFYSRQERITLNNGSTQNIKTTIDINTEPCLLEHFGGINSGFINLNLTGMFCISDNQPQLDQLAISGTSDSLVYETIVIQISECNENISSICALSNVREEYLTGGWFSVYYAGMTVDVKNYPVPVSRFRDTFQTTMSTANYKQVAFAIDNVNMTTDSGWLVEKHDTLEYLQQGKIKEYIEFKPNAGNILVTCTFVASQTGVSYTRAYTKIPDALAGAMGMSFIMMIILLFVITPYMRMKSYEALVNEIFDFNLEGLQKRSKNKPRKSRKSESFDAKETDDKKILYQLTDMHFVKKPTVATKTTTTAATEKDILSRGKRTTMGTTMGTHMEGFDSRRTFLTQKKERSDTIASIFQREKSSFKPSYTTEEPFFTTYRTSVENEQEAETSSIRKRDTRSTFKQVTFLKEDLTERRGSGNQKRTGTILKSFDSNFSKGISFTSPKLTLKEKSQMSPMTPNKILEESIQMSEISDDLMERKIIFEAKDKIEFTEPKDLEKQIKKDGEGEVLVVVDNKKPGEIEDVQSEESKELESQQEEPLASPKIAQLEQLPPNLCGKREKINITLREYLLSLFAYKPIELQVKIQLLEEGVRKMEKRLDIINLMKKLREIDKLKTLLLQDDQVVLFNNLPRTELKTRSSSYPLRGSPHRLLKKATFIAKPEEPEQILASYNKLVVKPEKTQIDNRLLNIYNESLKRSGFKK